DLAGEAVEEPAGEIPAGGVGNEVQPGPEVGGGLQGPTLRTMHPGVLEALEGAVHPREEAAEGGEGRGIAGAPGCRRGPPRKPGEEADRPRHAVAQGHPGDHPAVPRRYRLGDGEGGVAPGEVEHRLVLEVELA